MPASSEYIVLDTSVVSLLMKESAQADYYQSQITNRRPVLSFQTVEELWHGAYYANWGEIRQETLAILILQYEVIWPDRELVYACARLRAERKQVGRELGIADAWIAATALMLNAHLLPPTGTSPAFPTCAWCKMYPQRINRKAHKLATKYTEILRVTREHNGIPISLLLQTRNDNPPESYYCLSWRTLLPNAGKNRRFYRLREDGCWTIPPSVALMLLESADEAGMLDEDYDDPQIRHEGMANRIMDSRKLGYRERENTLNSIVGDAGEPGLGHEPLFTIIQVRDKTWHKIMIVDTRRKICTFRSTTTDDSYKPAILLPRTHWRMDNAMQDASSRYDEKVPQRLEGTLIPSLNS